MVAGERGVQKVNNANSSIRLLTRHPRTIESLSTTARNHSSIFLISKFSLMYRIRTVLHSYDVLRCHLLRKLLAPLINIGEIQTFQKKDKKESKHVEANKHIQ